MPEDKIEGGLPGDWEGKLTMFQRLLLIRVMRPDRVTAAMAGFVKAMMGARYIDQPTFNMKDTFEDSSCPQPLFFVLFPGVDPGGDIEKLGAELGFTLQNGKYKSISMGQGQEKNAEDALVHFAEIGGWVFLQNVHLMETWLPKLERALEICAETGHDDFRCFLSAEAPPLPTTQSVPEGIMQSSIKVSNEPPSDLKSNLRGAYALFSQETLDKSTRPASHKPMLFALCFFHSLALGRRKFGFQGFSRSYPFNNGDLTVCAQVLTTTWRTTPRRACRGRTSSTTLARSCTAGTSPTHGIGASPTRISRCCSTPRSSCQAPTTCSRPTTRRCARELTRSSPRTSKRNCRRRRRSSSASTRTRRSRCCRRRPRRSSRQS